MKKYAGSLTQGTGLFLMLSEGRDYLPHGRLMEEAEITHLFPEGWSLIPTSPQGRDECMLLLWDRTEVQFLGFE